MYIGRRPDNTIYGIWTTQQIQDEFHQGLEEVSETHPDVVAFRTRPRPIRIDSRDVKITELEARLSALETKT